MQGSNDIHSQIATALTGVIKQIKAIRYYPPRHPALNAAAEECLRGFQPLLQGGTFLSLTIRKDGFLFDDQLVAKGNQVLGQLAMFCFARRIQTLTILRDLTAKDLNHFVHYLTLDHQKIQTYGGIHTLLERAGVTTIWVNEKDLDTILARRAEMEEQPEQPDIDPMTVLDNANAELEMQPEAQALDLRQLLARLEQETDDERFRHGLQELVPLLRLNLKKENRPLVLRSMVLLCQAASSTRSNAKRRDYATQALGELTSSEVASYLIDTLIDEKTEKSSRQTLSKIIAFLRGKLAAPLMEKLANEKQASARKLLADTLIKCGSAAVPVLLAHLDDERWYVVRNAIAILGEIRNQEAPAHLRPLLQHDDLRVQREAIRALTKIGGPMATDILILAAQSTDQDLCRQALLSLGAMRAQSAVPTLRKLLQKSGWNQRTMDIKKDAIRALGEIRSTQALPDLLAIAGRKRLLRRRLNEELRIAAIHALGEIGQAEALPLLDKMTDDRSAAVARAAKMALKQIDKASP